MSAILDQVNEEDLVSIVTFSSDVSVWKPRPVKAIPSNIDNAKRYISSMEATGGGCFMKF